MNEELESTNQELGTTNADLEKHSRQLDAVRTFNESLLASIPLGVVALNRSLEVDAWNARAEDLWGIARAETVGLHFFNLDIGLPVAELHEVIRDCLDGGAGGQEVTLAATNRRGKEITCRVTCAPLGADKARSGGVVLLMEEVKAGS